MTGETLMLSMLDMLADNICDAHQMMITMC